jgi:hypothetical protein
VDINSKPVGVAKLGRQRLKREVVDNKRDRKQPGLDGCDPVEREFELTVLELAP